MCKGPEVCLLCSRGTSVTEFSRPGEEVEEDV